MFNSYIYFFIILMVKVKILKAINVLNMSLFTLNCESSCQHKFV